MSALDFNKIIYERIKRSNKELKYDIFETKILSQKKKKVCIPWSIFSLFAYFPKKKIWEFLGAYVSQAHLPNWNIF